MANFASTTEADHIQIVEEVLSECRRILNCQERCFHMALWVRLWELEKKLLDVRQEYEHICLISRFEQFAESFSLFVDNWLENADRLDKARLDVALKQFDQHRDVDIEGYLEASANLKSQTAKFLIDITERRVGRPGLNP